MFRFSQKPRWLRIGLILYIILISLWLGFDHFRKKGLPTDVVIDLGLITAGTDTGRKIEIRNSNSFSSISVDRVSTSCGCTSVSLEKTTIPPGGTCEVQFDVAIPVYQREGPKSDQVLITWRDTSGLLRGMHSSLFKVNSIIKPTYHAKRPNARYGDIREGDNTVRTVELSDGKEGKHAIPSFKLVEDAGNPLQVNALNASDKSDAEFSISLKTELMPGGEFRYSRDVILIDPEGNEFGQTRVTASGYLDRGVTGPHDIYLGYVEPGARKIQLSFQTPFASLSATQINSLHSTSQVKILDQQFANGKLGLSLEVDVKPSAGVVDDVFLIDLLADSGRCIKFQLPVLGKIKDSSPAYDVRQSLNGG